MRQHWSRLWYLCYRAVGSSAHLYFLALLTTGQYVLLQCFVAIMLGIYQSNRRIQTYQVQRANSLIRKIFRNKTVIENEEVVRQPYLTSQLLREFRKKLDGSNKKLEEVTEEGIMNLVSDEDFKKIQNHKILEDQGDTKGIFREALKKITIDPGSATRRETQLYRRQQNIQLTEQQFNYTRIMKIKQIMSKSNQTTQKQDKVQTIANDSPNDNYKGGRQRKQGYAKRESLLNYIPGRSLNNNMLIPDLKTPASQPAHKIFFNTLVMTPFKQASNFLNPAYFRPKKRRQSLRENQVKAMTQVSKSLSMAKKELSNTYSQEEVVVVKESWWRQMRRQVEETSVKKVLQYMSESSWLVFHQKSRVRQFLTRILATKFWDRFTLVLIFANGVLLVVDNPVKEKSAQLIQVTSVLNVVFTIIFLSEMTCKIISCGFLFNSVDNDKAYIRSYWNIVDFVVINFGAWVLIEKNNPKLKSLLVMRSFRALRPLKVINKNEQLKIIVNTLFQIIPKLGNVILILSLVIVSIALVFKETFKGTFYGCYDQAGKEHYAREGLVTKEDCLAQGLIWQNAFYNFDNLYSSSLAVFKVVAGGEWLELVQRCMDAQGVGLVPKQQFSLGVWAVYCLVILLGNVMLLNLLVGLVLDSFKQTKDKLEGYLGLSQEQREWADLQKFVQKRRLIRVYEFGEEGELTRYQRLQRQLYLLNRHHLFEKTVIFVSLGNISVMGATREDMLPTTKESIMLFHYLVLLGYHLEILIQLVGNGFYYFARGWARFDLLVILCTDLIFVLTEHSQSHHGAFRSIMVLRGIKLSKFTSLVWKSKVMLVILATYEKIFSQLISIGLLFSLFVFIFAIMGMNVFAKTWVIPYSSGVQPTTVHDCSTFTGCWMMLTQAATKQQWDYYMQQLGQDKQGCMTNQSLAHLLQNGIKGCTTPFVFPYFIIFIIIVPLVTMNLFVAVVIQGYEMSVRENEAELLPKHIDELIDKWSDYDPKATGFLTPQNFAFLLYELPPPIGFKDGSMYYEQQLLHQREKAQLLTSPNKKVVLSKRQVMEVNRCYNLILYQNRMLHFKDVYLCISHHVLCKKYQLLRLEINQKYVISQLNKGWYNMFPDLKRTHAENQRQLNINSEDLLSLEIITNYVRKWRDIRYQKRLKKQNIIIKQNIKREINQSKLLHNKKSIRTVYTLQNTFSDQKQPIDTTQKPTPTQPENEKYYETLLERGLQSSNKQIANTKIRVQPQEDIVRLSVMNENEGDALKNNFPFEVEMDIEEEWSGDKPQEEEWSGDKPQEEE